eukprot:4140951-Karenia_brevis.AAC.1
MFIHNCGRAANRTFMTCCMMCNSTEGPHTHQCHQRTFPELADTCGVPQSATAAGSSNELSPSLLQGVPSAPP